MPESQSASARIAAKLAAKKAAAEEMAVVDPESDALQAAEDDGVTDEADDLVGSDEAEEKPKGTMKERAAAARAARQKPTPITEAPSAKAKAKGPKVTSSKITEPTKKPPSPAQLAAREAFAERSRAKAAAKKAEQEAPTKKAIGMAERKQVQTEAEVKASQNAKRAAARKAAAEAVQPKRAPSGKPKTVQKASPSAAKKAAATKTAPAGAKTKAASTKKGKQGETKAKVLALWEQGKTRKQIMAATGLTYPAVFYHTKGTPGTGSQSRGRIFVQTPFDEEGNKLRGGKTVEVSRSESMRRMWLNGKLTISEVAKEHDVVYGLAYTAIRPLLDDDGDE